MPSRLSTALAPVSRRPESCRDDERRVVPAAGDAVRVLQRSSRPLSCATCNEALMTSSTPRKKSAARRARPAQPRRRGIARIEEILDAACHVLAQEGYGGVLAAGGWRARSTSGSARCSIIFRRAMTCSGGRRAGRSPRMTRPTCASPPSGEDRALEARRHGPLPARRSAPPRYSGVLRRVLDEACVTPPPDDCCSRPTVTIATVSASRWRRSIPRCRGAPPSRARCWSRR